MSRPREKLHLSVDKGSCCRSTLLAGDATELQEVINRRAVKVLRAQVRGVAIPADLVQSEGTLSNAFLDPQLADRQVTHTPNARAATYPNGCAAVRVEGQVQLQAHIPSQGLHAEALGCSLDHPSEFSLPDDNVMCFCVVAQCLITWAPRKIKPPDVERRVA